MDLQFYTERIVVESEANTTLVTVSKVDLGELAGQVSFSEMASHYDYEDIINWVHSNNEENE